MIPGWLAKKRHDTCHNCAQAKGCQIKFKMLDPAPACPLDKLPPLSDELKWARAWPEDVPAISGCCDRVG